MAIVLVGDFEVCHCFSSILIFFNNFPVAVQVIKYGKTHLEFFPLNTMAENHPHETELGFQEGSTW